MLTDYLSLSSLFNATLYPLKTKKSVYLPVISPGIIFNSDRFAIFDKLCKHLVSLVNTTNSQNLAIGNIFVHIFLTEITSQLCLSLKEK